MLLPARDPQLFAESQTDIPTVLHPAASFTEPAKSTASSLHHHVDPEGCGLLMELCPNSCSLHNLADFFSPLVTAPRQQTPTSHQLNHQLFKEQEEQSKHAHGASTKIAEHNGAAQTHCTASSQLLLLFILSPSCFLLDHSSVSHLRLCKNTLFLQCSSLKDAQLHSVGCPFPLGFSKLTSLLSGQMP